MKATGASLVTTVALAALGGCMATTNSEYVPRDRGRTTLVMKEGVIALARGGSTLPLRDFMSKEEVAAGFFACDARAAKLAREASSNWSSAESWRVLAMGLIPALVVRMYVLDGNAHFADAINVANDAPACAQGR